MGNKLIVATQRGLKFFQRKEDFWEERDYALTGVEITSLDMLGDVGLVGTTGGVYVTRDGGENWILESDGIETPHVRWVRIHPQEHHHFFVGTEPANVYSKMIDAEQWQRSDTVAEMRDQNEWYMPYSPNPGCVRGFAFQKNRIYAAVEVGGLLFSEDLGETWALVPGSTGKPRHDPEPGQLHPDVHSIETAQASKDLLYAPTGGGFYTSGDAGKIWELKYRCYCRAVWVDPNDPSQMVLGPADGVGRGGRIELSTDGGATWRVIMDNLVNKWSNMMVERFVSSDNEIFAILSNGTVLTAHIGEFSWQSLLPGLANIVMLAVV